MDSEQLASVFWKRVMLSTARSLVVASLPGTLFLLLLWGLSVSASRAHLHPGQVKIEAMSSSQAASGHWYVSSLGNDSNSCSVSTAPCRRIQDALDKATVGDTVNVAEGTYTDSVGTVAQIIQDVRLLGGWDDSFSLRDPVAHPAVLDAQGKGPVVVISGPVGLDPISPVVEGFVLTNGNGTGVAGCIAPGAEGCGGGIFGANTTPYILNNVISDNVATSKGTGYGGGIFLQGAFEAGTIEGNIIVRNKATISSTAVISGWGGGICLYYNAPMVYDNLIQDNIASAARGWGYGGGVLLYRSTSQVISNVVVNNIASTAATGERSGWGGGISVFVVLNDGSSIIDNVVRDNTASLAGHGWGGGIQVASSNVLVSGNRIIGNVAGASTDRGDGGGIYARYGTWTIRDNQILSNTATTMGTGFGGGCQLEYGNVIFEQNLVAGNTSTLGDYNGWGGGINLLGCDGSVVRRNTIRDNLASLGRAGYGGGVSVRFGPLTLEGNYILNNRATGSDTSSGRGGGVAIDRSDPVTLTNNVIVYNHAQTEGGGVYAFGDVYERGILPSHAVLIHNTLAENSRAGSGEGVYVSQYATASLTNNIIVSHSYGIYCSTDSSRATADYTLFYGNRVADTGGVVISRGVITGAAHFVAPTDEDFHIGPASAALDSGTSTHVVSDIDGDVRPTGKQVDVGADERCVKIHLPLLIKSN